MKTSITAAYATIDLLAATWPNCFIVKPAGFKTRTKGSSQRGKRREIPSRAA